MTVSKCILNCLRVMMARAFRLCYLKEQKLHCHKCPNSAMRKWQGKTEELLFCLTFDLNSNHLLEATGR